MISTFSPTIAVSVMSSLPASLRGRHTRLRHPNKGIGAKVPRRRCGLGTKFCARHYPAESPPIREPIMFGWVVTFLLIGLIAALLGFGGIAGTSFAIAKVIFFIALILLLLSIIVGAVRRPL